MDRPRTVRCSAFIAFAAALVGCLVGCKDVVHGAVDDVPRSIRNASRARAASAWAGTYVFSECAPSPPPAPCWAYEVVVTSSGTATLKADGGDMATHVNATPRVMENETLRLAFESYIDGGPGPTFFQLGPINKQGFDKGEVLATMGRDRAGRMCLAFGALASKLATKMACASR